MVHTLMASPMHRMLHATVFKLLYNIWDSVQNFCKYVLSQEVVLGSASFLMSSHTGEEDSSDVQEAMMFTDQDVSVSGTVSLDREFGAFFCGFADCGSTIYAQ